MRRQTCLTRRAFVGRAALAAAAGVAMLAGVAVPARSGALALAETAGAGDLLAVRVASLKGPTSIGLAPLIDEVRSSQGTGEVRADASSGGEARAGASYAGDAADGSAPSYAYDFSVYATADEVLPLLIKGELDIALLPANVGAVLYNKTEGGVRAVNVNTLGVLYAVSGDASVTQMADLAGRVVYMTGKGTTPEYVTAYLLDAAGIADEVTLEFKSEAAEVAAILEADPAAVGVLPEPYVTSACAKNEALLRSFSLTDAWDELQGEGADGAASRLVTGVTLVRAQFAEAHPQAVADFVARQRSSVERAVADPDATGELVAQLGIIDSAAVAAQAVPNCNLVCITGQEMVDALSGYLEVLFEADPSSVGGALPGEDFYLTDLAG